MDVRVQGDGLVLTTDGQHGEWKAQDWLQLGMRLPSRFTRQLFEQHRVWLGAVRLTPDAVVPPGRRIHLRGGVEADAGLSFRRALQPAEVLWEDEHFLVVNKPAGLLIHPGTPEDTDTLDHRVAALYAVRGERRRVLHAHRLDRETSGAVLYAKHAYAARAADAMVAGHEVTRVYLAVTDSVVRPQVGTIVANIGRDRHVAGRYRVTARGGMPAVTHYRTLAAAADGRALILCTLETGRTHQIRVHLSARGAPVAGDALYGSRTAWPAGHALHAWELSFVHPYTGERVRAQAPLPTAWRSYWATADWRWQVEEVRL